MTKSKIEGGCHCGSVRYQLTVEPDASMVCHCRTCQAISGAPVMAWLTVKPAAFAITKGKPKLYASSKNVERQFCGACGAQLTYRRTTNKSYIDVATATLDDPDAFPPTHHSWLGHDIAWVKFGDRLPKFQKSRGDG